MSNNKISLVDGGSYVLTAFSHDGATLGDRKCVIAKITDSFFEMTVHVINTDFVPFQMVWDAFNGLTIVGVVEFSSASSSMHIIKVRY